MQPITEFDHPDHGWKWTELELRWINARIAAEVAAEREACAKVCENTMADAILGGNKEYNTGREMGAIVCANKIRMRSNF